jgi:hypothetical protein
MTGRTEDRGGVVVGVAYEMTNELASSGVVSAPIGPGEPPDPRAVKPKATARPARNVPKWEQDARARMRIAVRRFSKPLGDLLERDANEGDTRLLVTDFLCEGMGFDKFEDLTTEYQVKGEFADYGMRIDKQLIAFIEVKRCTQKLGVKHLRQVQSYAVNEGVEWMVLTNGQVWQVYHLTGGLPVIVDLALEVDLLGDGSSAQKADALFHLSKEALKRRLLDDLWRAKAATSPKSLSEVVLDTVRKEVRRRTGFNGDTAELARVIRDEVIRPEAL